jgi:A/G-specific adenine glycosylase
LDKDTYSSKKTGELSGIVEPLLKWYKNNARALPWRKNTNPYHVWVSEIMLQQTQVETVIPYYERFLRQIPDIAGLAEVNEELLLKQWEGLGYYTRARNLQKAAQMIMSQFGGRFPEAFGDMLMLPGIGKYTAGAIASICFGQPVPAVDGNVLRVVARITGSREDIAAPDTKESFADC